MSGGSWSHSTDANADFGGAIDLTTPALLKRAPGVDGQMDLPQEASLFERIGGASAIGSLVAALYERLRADPELSPFFRASDRMAQHRTLSDLLTDALGGPVPGWRSGPETGFGISAGPGLELSGEANADGPLNGRAVSNRHFSLLCAHLIDVLESVGIGDDEADDLIEWVGRARSAVVAE
jgi:hemoglobin